MFSSVRDEVRGEQERGDCKDDGRSTLAGLRKRGESRKKRGSASGGGGMEARNNAYRA